MRIFYRIVGGAIVVGASFFGTLRVLDYFTPPLIFEVNLSTIEWYPGTNGERTVQGVRIVSKFNTPPKNALTDGAAYFNVRGPHRLDISGKKIRIEYDITVETSGRRQGIEIQFTQNGLKSSGWKEILTEPGRGIYALSYVSPRDERDSSKIDTIWLRGDSSGLGRPIMVHSINIFVE